MHKLPKGVHRVRRKTKSGTKFHFYAWRGGPKFWEAPEHSPSCHEFLIAFAGACEQPKKKPMEYLTPKLVDDFLSSLAVSTKSPRTQADYRKWCLRFSEGFKSDPVAMFEEADARGEVIEWCDKWEHSPKQHYDASNTATRLLNWAVTKSKLKIHYCHKLPKYYAPNRAEIVWTLEDIDLFCSNSPEYAQRILVAACETGLRPGDLSKLTWAHVKQTPQGRRIQVRTSKRKRLATIPVSRKLEELLEKTPRDRMLILVGDNGQALSSESASKAVSRWRSRILPLTPEVKGYDLRLYDARGTAATRLLEAGLGLNDIASHMAWSIRYAAQVIEHYAVVSPDETDRVRNALEAALKTKMATKL